MTFKDENSKKVRLAKLEAQLAALKEKVAVSNSHCDRLELEALQDLIEDIKRANVDTM